MSIVEQENAEAKRLRLIEELLAKVADLEDDSAGEFDPVDAIRYLRESREASITR